MSHSGTPAHQIATTSAPLPLSRQPGFSAHHAARMGVMPPMTATTTSSNSPPTPATATAPYSLYAITPPPILGYRYPEQPLYYSQDPKPPSNPGSRPQTSHSASGPPYAPTAYFDAYNPQETRSYGHSSASHATSLSNEYSLPPPSEASTQSPSDAWRYKPLPPLPASSASAPATSTRTTRGYSLNIGDQGASYRATPPAATSNTSLALRSRAFSNPGSMSQEYSQAPWYQTHYVPTGTPVESRTPTSYHQPPSEYEPPKEGHFYPRYTTGQHPSPGGLSSASSYADPPPSGQPSSIHGLTPSLSGRASNSPVDRRTTRLSYDSNQVGTSLLGKRPSWSNDEERVTKRPRTDEGHRQAYPVARTGIYHPPPTALSGIPPLVPVYPLQPPAPQQTPPQQQATPVTPSQQQRIPDPLQGPPQ